MQQMLDGLQTGLLLAVLVIFLLLAANFQSIKLSLIVVSTAPAVIAGVALTLWLTHTTLNIQSFMGAIMAVGVAVANAILLVTFAERTRMSGATADVAAVDGAQSRLRPILMTSLAMIAGCSQWLWPSVKVESKPPRWVAPLSAASLLPRSPPSLSCRRCSQSFKRELIVAALRSIPRILRLILRNLRKPDAPINSNHQTMKIFIHLRRSVRCSSFS